MKKKEILARYSELVKNRHDHATASANALVDLIGVAEREGLPIPDIASLHSDIIAATAWDMENDQREIANLIYVADSYDFADEVRAEARRRIVIMLEL